MKRLTTLPILLGGLFLCAWARAEQGAGFFPASHELFKPLLADPRELQYALRLVMPVSGSPKGEAVLGDYLGVYRWNMGNGRQSQFSVGGGVFGRFKLATDSNALQVADYFGNAPFDFRAEKWSTRLMWYHTSSHLGDDYLRQTGLTTAKHTWDYLRFITSYDASEHLRLYGGYTYAYHSLPKLERHAVQGGFEAYSSWTKNGYARAYWANDFQSWARNDWNPIFTSQLGVNLVKDPKSPRGITIFTEYGVGNMSFGQFFDRKESHWSLGVKFDLS